MTRIRSPSFLVPTALILVLAGIFFREFFTGPLPGGDDALAWFVRARYETLNGQWPSPWLSSSGLGQATTPGIMDFLLRILFQLDIDGVLVKVLVFLMFVGTGVGFFLLTDRFTGDWRSGTFAAIAGMLGRPIIGQYIEGHYSIVLGYALTPFIVIEALQLREKWRIEHGLVLSMLLSVFLSSVNLSYVYMFVLLSVPLALVEVAYLITRRYVQPLHVAYTLLSVASALVFAAPFFGALVLNPPGFIASPFSFFSSPYVYTCHGNPCSWFGALTLAEIEGFNLTVIPFPDTAFPATFSWLLSLVLVGLAFSAVALRRRRYVLYLLFIAISSSFLAKGTAPPFGEIYAWMFYHVPFFPGIHTSARWLLFTDIAYVILGSITISELYSRVKVPISVKHVYVAFFVWTLLLSTAVGFYTALPSYNLQPAEAQAFNWIAAQRGDFLVLSVPMLNGWTALSPLVRTWDFGIMSPMFTGKGAVTGVEQPDQRSAQFLSYLAKITSQERPGAPAQIMNLLGVLGIRFVIIQPYATEPMQKFFENQEGASLVFSQENVSIYENSFWNPRVFVPDSTVSLFGGYQSLAELAASGLLNDTDVILANNDIRSFGDSPALVLSDSSWKDFVISVLPDARATRIPWTLQSQGSTGGFVLTNLEPSDDYLAGGGPVISATVNASLTQPFTIGEGATYQVWARVLRNMSGGQLAFSIDGQSLSAITVYARPPATFWEWVYLGNSSLSQGSHDLNISSIIPLGSEALEVDKIILTNANLNDLESQESSLFGSALAFLSDWKYFSGDFKLVDMLGGSTGLELLHQGASSVDSRIEIPASGNYTFAFRVSSNVTSTLIFSIGNVTHEIAIPPSGGNVWIRSDWVPLQRGNYTLYVSGVGTFLLDLTFIERQGIEMLMNSENTAHVSEPLGYTMSQDYYGGFIHATSSIVLRDTYSENWVLSSGTTTVRHYAVYGVLNGYSVDGPTAFTISYGADKWYVILESIAAGAWIFSAAFLITPRNFRERILKGIQRLRWQENVKLR